MKWWKSLLVIAVSGVMLQSTALPRGVSAAGSSPAIETKQTVQHVDPVRFLVYDAAGNPLKGPMLERNGVWYVPLAFITEHLKGEIEFLDNGNQAKISLPGKETVQISVAREHAVTRDQQVFPISAQKPASGTRITPIGGLGSEFYVPYDFFAAALGIPLQTGQENGHKVITIGDPPASVQRLNTSKPVSMSGKAVVRVNGVELPNQGAVYQVDGILYVPIATPVWEMGGKMEQGYSVEDIRNWDRSLSRFRLANEQVIESRAGDSVVKVSGQYKPVLTQQKTAADGHPVSAPVLKINEGLYVPYDFYRNILKYPVEVRKEEGKQIIFVGKIPTAKPVYDLPYKPPYGWMPPKIKSKATNDMNANLKILQNELYFYQGFFIPYGNPSGKRIESYAIRVNSGYKPAVQASIFFSHWRGSAENPESEKIPYVARELFKFFLPSKGQALFQIMDNGYNGKDVDQYVDKVFTLDNRSILIKEYPRTLQSAGGVEVFIGKQGMPFDKNLNTVKPAKKK